MALVKAAAISGFPEWSPRVRLAELRLTDLVRRQYDLYGFAPIETPAVERMEVLTAKGGIQRQIFTVGRPGDDDGEAADLGLHFDLTVPLARYVVQHAAELVFPFRRQQIQKVWRGERAQRGRFREFTQCDIDIVGSGHLDPVHDAEVLPVINSVFDAMDIPGFEIRVSNRKILGAVFADAPGTAADALRAVDRLGRSDPEALNGALEQLGADKEQIDAVVALTATESVDQARRVLSGFPQAARGLAELDAVVHGAIQLGLPEDRLRTDFSIARGLDYYTGTVCETFITGHEDWGSVCSGGRYDDLASFFTNRSYPGVGVSIGLSRLVDLLIRGEYLPASAATPAVVLVATQDRDEYLHGYLGLARTLRTAGIPTEVFLQPAPLRDQISYASAQGIPVAVIAGRREFDDDTAIVRDLRHHVQQLVTGDDIVRHVRGLLVP